MSRQEKEAPWAPGDRRFDGVLAVFVACLAIYTLVTFRSKLGFVSGDVRDFFIPWYQHILSVGRWPAIEGSYATYTPPYLYFLSLASLLDGVLSPVTLIKFASLPFLLLSAYLAFSLCRALGASVLRSGLAAALLCVAPEIVQDVLQWGQCDIQYTTFLLLFLRLFVARRPGWAMFAFGIALSFKLQAIFAGPVLLALLIAGELPLWSVLAVPFAYCVAMGPAALAGRPVGQLLAIYTQQYGIYPEIAMGAPNPYEMTLHWTKQMTGGPLYNGLVRGGLVVALVATAGLVVFLLRARCLRSSPGVMAALGLSLLLEPFVLPKMHERYIFPGDTVLLILAAVAPRMALPAALLQITALLVYEPYLSGHMRNAFYYAAPLGLMAFCLAFLVRELGSGRFERSWRERFPAPPLTEASALASEPAGRRAN